MADGFRRSMSELAKDLHWKMKDGKPYKARVQRASERLKKSKLMASERGTLVLTKTGQKEADRITGMKAGQEPDRNADYSAIRVIRRRDFRK